jgi:hypothetical protein
MIPIAYGLVAGGIAGMVKSVLIHLAPLIVVNKKHLPDIDNHFFLGKRFTRRETHFLGILTQLFFSTIFGGLYVLLVDKGIIFENYHYLSILFYGVMVWFLKGALVLPFLGVGFFGVKQGKYVWFELFLMHQIYAIIFWLAMHLYV